jgi:mannose-P-dolichol utilization defect protein 1
LVYGVFNDHCYAKLNQPEGIDLFFADRDCLKFTASKLVGYLIVLGAVIVKVPQILKIVMNCSTKGINAISYYTETISYVQTAAYSVHLGLQFSVFGETLFITAQNMAIIALMWHFDHQISMTEKILFSAFFVGYSAVLFSGMVPEEGWALVSSSTILLMLMSRLPQIYQNYCAKSTGHLAFITFLLMFLGSAARTATVFFESEDLMLRVQYGLGLLFGGIIMV